jgi:hypothetical protein
MNAGLDDRLAAWILAERSGDGATLTDLIHPDFLGVGPFGFILTHDEWTQRFAAGLHYTAFEFTPDRPTRYDGNAAVMVGTQTQAGTYQGRPIDGAFRVTLMFTDEPAWRLLAAHLSLRNPPGAAT